MANNSGHYHFSCLNLDIMYTFHVKLFRIVHFVVFNILSTRYRKYDVHVYAGNLITFQKINKFLVLFVISDLVSKVARLTTLL